MELRAGGVISDALHLYRRNAARVALTAVVVYAPLTLLAAFVLTQARDLHDEHGTWSAAAAGLLALGAISLPTLGDVVFAGFLGAALEWERLGQDEPSLRRVLRELPIGPLVLADVAVTLAITVGAAACIVPGLLAATLLCLTGPIVAMSGVSARQGVAESARVVRHHFGLTFMLVTLPMLLERQALRGAMFAAWNRPPAAALIVAVVVAIAVSSVVAVIEVTLTERLTNQP
jgi:chromate transport protein ChrA